MSEEATDITAATEPSPHSDAALTGGFSLQFENASSLRPDDEVAVPLSPQYKTFKKLEVVTSRRINFMSKLYNLVSFTALALSIAVVIVARTALSETAEDVPIVLSGEALPISIDLTIYTFPTYFTVVDFSLALLVFFSTLLLVCVYCIVLAAETRARVLNEQAWVVMLLVSTLLYLIPYEPVIRFREAVRDIRPPNINEGFSVVDFLMCLRMSSFSVIFLLYLWMGGHGYRFLHRRVSLRDYKFYVVKVLAVALYVIYKIVIFYVYRIVFSEVPFASFVAFLNLYSTAGMWPVTGVVTVVVLTALELALAVGIGVDLRKTFKQLKASDYARHRTNILGFRFFLHQHVVFYTVYVVTYAFLLFGLPIGPQLLQFFLEYDRLPGRASYFDVQYAPFGLHLCVLAFAATEAYTNLPADANVWHVLCPCWWGAIDGETQQPPSEPVMYLNREPRSRDVASNATTPMQVRANCFVMETNIELFNLAWFVYYHGTAKEHKVRVDFDKLNMRICECLYDEATDTKAIVAETPDRIIFAFKGTSSSQNLRTDLRVNHHALSAVVGASPGSATMSPSSSPPPSSSSSVSAAIAASARVVGSDRAERDETSVPLPTHDGNHNVNIHDNSRNDCYDGSALLGDAQTMRAFRRARVHAGFANAYRSVKGRVLSVARRLLAERERAVCFTGHSLGGALATLGSLDVQLTLGMAGDRVAVSSFGSPRVGNDAFQQVYDAVVRSHWRVVAGGDLISRLPKLGYRHVGRKVLLSADGELFIDPSALEVIFWHSQSASLVHHRKACYMLALKAWCDRRGEYQPELWPFPISRSDSRRFDSAFRRAGSSATVPLSAASGSGPAPMPRAKARQAVMESRAERLQRYAEAIDALGENSPQARMSDESLRLWKRLAEAALAQLRKEDETGEC